jgi:hypothetical protein
MMKRGLPILAVLILSCLASCTSPDPSGLKAIVGARLITAPGRAPIEYSVVVIENGKFRDVGPQASVPVPKGAELTRGIGMTIEPAPGSGPIEPGQPADLVLQGATQRVMHDGQWVP